MPVDSTATAEVTAYRWVPDFAQGLVRDLRVRWAIEEIGRRYRVRLLDAMNPRPADYFSEQPFGQVPAYRDDQVQLFESGAIVLHLAIEEERLLPSGRNERMRAVAWMIAALNSVEPAIFPLILVNVFNKGEAWAEEARPKFCELLETRLNRVSDALADKEWLEDRFTIGDLMMVAVLRQLRGTDLIEKFPNIAALVARAEARPAFQAALAAQCAVFAENEPDKVPA